MVFILVHFLLCKEVHPRLQSQRFDIRSLDVGRSMSRSSPCASCLEDEGEMSGASSGGSPRGCEPGSGTSNRWSSARPCCSCCRCEEVIVAAAAAAAVLANRCNLRLGRGPGASARQTRPQREVKVNTFLRALCQQISRHSAAVRGEPQGSRVNE